MKYTLSDIRIKDPFPQYDGRGLDIKYTVEGKSRIQLLALSDASLMHALMDIGEVVDIDKEHCNVRKSNNYSWTGLDYFLENYWGIALAEKLVIHHLNNKTEKP